LAASVSRLVNEIKSRLADGIGEDFLQLLTTGSWPKYNFPRCPLDRRSWSMTGRAWAIWIF
jgi:hypothetical protein